VIAASQAPDHATRVLPSVHEGALAELSPRCCRCAERHANLDYEDLAREILKEAARIDAAEDELYGEQRGDELPEQLQTSEGRASGRAGRRPAQARARSGDRIHTDPVDLVVPDRRGRRLPRTPRAC
jgi:hypothetical protein